MAEVNGYDAGKKKQYKTTFFQVEDDFLVDRGYRGEKFAKTIESNTKIEVEVMKQNELHTFSVLPKRRIFERSFGWLDKCRSLWKKSERKIHNTFQMVTLVFIRLLLLRYWTGS